MSQININLYFFQEWNESENKSYKVIILNDRLMSETVQSEHSYFNSASTMNTNLDDDNDLSNDADLIGSHGSSFKGRNKTVNAL